MRIRIFLFLIALCSFFLIVGCAKDDTASPSNEITTFQKTFDKGHYEKGIDLLELDTGDFILLSKGPETSGMYTADIIKTDKNGNELWTKNISDLHYSSHCYAIYEVENSFIVAGACDAPEAAFLIGIDHDGNEIWRNTYLEDIEDLSLVYFDKTFDNRIIIAASYYGWSSDTDDGTVLKVLDSNGNLINEHNVLNVEYYDFKSCETGSGGYLFADYDYRDFEIDLHRISDSGQIEWSYSYQLENYHIRPLRICPASDGGFYIVGNTNDGSYANYFTTLLKINSEGEQEWFNVYYYEIDVTDIIETSDNTIAVTGRTYTDLDENNYSTVTLFRADASGALIDVSQYEPNYRNSGSSIIETADGGYAIIGTTYDNSTLLNDILFLKTDQNGIIH